MIGGHDEPSSGTISLDGQMLNGVEPAKRPVTTVFQHFALFPHRSVLQNVAFGLKMRGIGKAEREKTAGDAVEMVGLGSMRQRKPRELSSGQQQRVALARVLVTRPKAILLDEPFGDLDRLLQLRMRVELRALQRDLGITFIHVTHNQEEALSMSDRIVVMSTVIQQTGTPTGSPATPRTSSWPASWATTTPCAARSSRSTATPSRSADHMWQGGSRARQGR
jgi:ABC-type Fe3+/spermidine/putrescine transport system ATPase subunit